MLTLNIAWEMSEFIVLVTIFRSFFFFNDTATTEIYTLSLHDALPISSRSSTKKICSVRPPTIGSNSRCVITTRDRKSTRLNSSHANISYAVFCLKKKKKLYKIRVIITYVFHMSHIHL